MILKILIFFIKKEPYTLLSAIFTNLISQISLLVMYLLPLKIVIITFSKKVPNFIHNYFTNFTINEFISLLIFITLVSFLVHVTSEKLIKIFSKKIAKSKFIIKEDKFVHKFIDNFILSFSTLFVILLLFMCIIYFYTFIALAILLLASIIYIVIKTFNIKLEYHIVKIIMSIGFFVIFIVEIIDVLYIKSQNYSLTSAVIFLVILRYISIRLQSSFNRILFLLNNWNNFTKRIEK